MSRSMWSFSGRHWLRSFALWGIFGSGIALALEERPELQTGLAVNPPETAKAEEISPVAVAVILNLRRMDLAGLDVSDFGDVEASARH